MAAKRSLAVLLWVLVALVSAAWVFAAMNLRSPYFLRMRDTVYWLWLGVGVLAALLIIFRRNKIFGRWHPFHLVVWAALLGAVFAGIGQRRHDEHRHWVANTPKEGMPAVAKHLVIGWLGFSATRTLAAKGAIAGIFLTNRDFPQGATVTEIRHTIDLLQTVRREAGLPPLWVCTDQEGGLVSKFSPPLPYQPGLKSLLADLDVSQPDGAAEIVRRVTVYADAQGQALAEIGINLNFAPVVDLRPAAPPDALDFHSHIASRALSADPATVALAGEIYVRVLATHGVTAVLKHFPGLGRVPNDTHHFAASLDTPMAVLETTDWLPFREIAKHTKTGIMLSHVRVASIDAVHPASCSSPVTKLLREKWGFTGLLVTDDFSMTPIYHGPGGLIGAAKQSMAAGVDLILLSYDAEAVYDVLAAQRE